MSALLAQARPAYFVFLVLFVDRVDKVYEVYRVYLDLNLFPLSSGPDARQDFPGLLNYHILLQIALQISSENGGERWRKGENSGYEEPTRYSKTTHFVIGRSRVQLSPSAPTSPYRTVV